MTTPAILLLLLSTFLHAGWNLVSKRQNPTGAFFCIASLTAALCLLPLLFVQRDVLPRIPPGVWGLLLVTGVSQTVYYVGLAGAYRHGDMSVAYPLARAIPVLLVTGVSFLLGLGKPLSAWGLAGIAAVGSGCLILPLASFRAVKLANYRNICCAFALLAALGTTGYTLIDNEALRQLRTPSALGLSTTQASLLYTALQTLATALTLTGYVLLVRRERRACRAIWQTGLRKAMVAGLLITVTYGLVLSAMAYVTNVSYLAAFRQLSIPLGAVFGIVLQKEPAHPPKLIGIGVVLVGLLAIGLA